jgi:hypothetical protein
LPSPRYFELLVDAKWPGKCTFPFQKEFRSSKSRAEHNEARIRPKNEQILGGQFLDPARMQMTARGGARGRVSGFWLFQGMYPISRWGSQRNNRDGPDETDGTYRTYGTHEYMGTDAAFFTYSVPYTHPSHRSYPTHLVPSLQVSSRLTRPAFLRPASRSDKS